MLLSLSKNGPPIWFLGPTSNLLVSLNYLDPGPKEVDFNTLSILDKKIVILAIRAGQVVSNLKEEVLLDIYKKELIALTPKVKEKTDDRVKSLLEKSEQETTSLETDCSELVKQPFKILNEMVLERKNDIKFLRILLKQEEKNKNRSSVKSLIKKCQKELSKVIKEKIEETKPSLKVSSSTLEMTKLEKTLSKSVVESGEDKEEITLTEEEFRALAEGRAL